MKITYTFPHDCQIADLRGVTVSGGEVRNVVINKVMTEVVVFETKVNGKSVTAKVIGKPELEAAVACIKAEAAKAKADARTALELAVPGLADYEKAAAVYSNAVHAYDKASECGYPVKQAAAADGNQTTVQGRGTEESYRPKQQRGTSATCAD